MSMSMYHEGVVKEEIYRAPAGTASKWHKPASVIHVDRMLDRHSDAMSKWPRCAKRWQESHKNTANEVCTRWRIDRWCLSVKQGSCLRWTNSPCHKTGTLLNSSKSVSKYDTHLKSNLRQWFGLFFWLLSQSFWHITTFCCPCSEC